MNASQIRKLENELRYEEKCIDLLEESALPHRIRRDELRRELAKATEEDRPLNGFEIEILCDADD